MTFGRMTYYEGIHILTAPKPNLTILLSYLRSLDQGTLSERKRLITVNLLLLTSLNQLFFKLLILFTFLNEQVTLMRRSTVLSLTL
jgi:hypothetical protein